MGMTSKTYTGPGPTVFNGEITDVDDFGSAEAILMGGVTVSATASYVMDFLVSDLVSMAGARTATAEEMRTNLSPVSGVDGISELMRVGLVVPERYVRIRITATGASGPDDIHCLWILGHPHHGPVPDQVG